MSQYQGLVRTVVEFKVFTRLAQGHLSGPEREALVDAVAADPNVGELLQGGGGATKAALASLRTREIARCACDHVLPLLGLPNVPALHLSQE